MAVNPGVSSPHSSESDFEDAVPGSVGAKVGTHSAYLWWHSTRQARKRRLGWNRAGHVRDEEARGRMSGDIRPLFLSAIRGVRRYAGELRCRRPTGSGTGGIRISPPGSAMQYRVTSEYDVTGQACLACGQIWSLASLFRASDRDGILVPGVRYDAQGQARHAAFPDAHVPGLRTAAPKPAQASPAFSPAARRRPTHRAAAP